MQRRVAVIGGGLAGLTAAASAARAGASVTLYEARSEVGGRGRTEIDGGYYFNQGAHALYAAAAGAAVLRSFGITPRGRKPPTSGAYGRLRGELGLLPGTPIDALKSRLVGLRAKAQLGALLASPKRAGKKPTANRSMAQWIDEQVSHPDARLILRMAARIAVYSDDLENIAAEAAVMNMVGALTDGVLYLDGGWQQIVDAMRVVAESGGVKIIESNKVESIDAVEDADAIVFAGGGPKHAASFLGARSAEVHVWAEQQQPIYASTLDLAMRSLPRGDRRFVMGVDEPLYLSVHTPSAALAPPGGDLMHVLWYGSDDDARPQMESLLDDAQPGWRDQVAAERFGRRQVVAHGRPTPATGLAGRPGPTISDCDNVFVAGDWVGPTGLLGDAAIASGDLAGRLAAVS